MEKQENLDDYKKLREQTKKYNDEKYRESSKKRLMKNVERKFKTTMIGALSTLESSFGFLWGFEVPEEDKTPEQKKVYEIYEEARAQILDRGNTQIRNLESEFVNYDIVRKRYQITLPVKTIRTGEQEDE